MNIEESIMYLKIKINTSKKQIESGEIWLDSLVSEEKNSNEAIETLLTAYEKEKRLAEANLKDSEEFQDNMCNHRCILNSKVEELEAELKKEEEKNKEYKDMIIRHKKQLKQAGIYGYDYDLEILEEE